MRNHESRVAKSAPVVAAVAASAHRPMSLRQEAELTGIPKTTLQRRRAAELKAVVQSAPPRLEKRPFKPKASASTAPTVDVGLVAALAAIADTQRQQSNLLAALLVGRTPVATPVPVETTTSASALTSVLAAPAFTAPKEHFVGPLGDNRPYAGEIFGTKVRRKARVAAMPTTAPRLTLVIGDSHFHPAIAPLTIRCMTLAALHAVDRKPEHIVHIGDGGDWSSVCRHTRNDTWAAREKPSIRQDLDGFRENWNALNAPLDEAYIATGARHYCMGNHDAWLNNFEDDHPELHGLATGEHIDILRGAGWSHTDYGEYYWLGGVGYVHVPLNIMGRPAGGQTAENTIAMQSARDTVLGHTHRHAVGRRIKMDGVTVTALNCGSSMPEFYVGEYAQLGQGRALDYGVLEVIDFDSRIQSFRFVSMRELEVRYGEQADRRLA